MAKSLYICYFGVNEPLVQTQVIPYLHELVRDGHEISLVTFEGKTEELWNDQLGAIKRSLAEKGIDWHWLKYHKRFSALATAYDIVRGAFFVRRMIGRKKLDILHGRVHVPTLMGALGRKLSRRKPKLLFDIRGFFPEEYTDAGIWPENGWLYRSAKRVERWLLKEANGFVVLTEKARQILFPGSDSTGVDQFGRPVQVIPCCVDLERFQQHGKAERSDMREQLGTVGRLVVAYIGSFGGWYLTDEMIELFAAAREYRPDSFALILTQRGTEKISQRLQKRGFLESDFLVRAVPPGEIADYLAASDIAISFIKACYSKLSSSPTKIAEYLAAGLPVIANGGVGDVDDLIIGNKVGTIVEDFSKGSYIKALREVEALGDVRNRCREVSIKEFDLSMVGGTRYRFIYSNLLHEQNGKVP
jgi:glycosyltransferase involved in cell wall biosynthesis